MGRCGCSEGDDYKLPGPGGLVYTVKVYQPCSYCETPGGVILSRYTGEDLELFDVDSLPEPEWQRFGTDRESGDVFLTVFDPGVLRTRLRAYVTDMDEEDVDAEGLPDLVEDALKEAVFRQGPLVAPEPT